MPQLNHKKTMNMPTKVESNYVQDAMKNKSHDPDDFEFQLNSTTARLLSTTLSTSSSLSGTHAESLVDRSMEVVFMPKTIPIDSNSSKTRSAVNGLLASSDDPDRTMTRKYSIVSTKATDGDSKTKKISLTSPNEFLSDLSSSNASSLVDIACALKLQQKDDSGKELDSAKTWKNGETTSLSFDRGKWMSDDPTEIADEAGLEEDQNVNDVVEVFCDEKSCNEGDCGFNGVRDSRTDVERRKVPGCVHYKRRAMFVTPCCNKFYKCRYCHDENEDHHFDRKTLTELICSECDTRQRVQETCEKCCVRFGKYTCLICNLFDDEDKSQYHCYGCGICRIGGRKNFFHCEVCNMCLPIQLKIDGHRCVENISRSNCPVCLGDIHTSRIPCHIPDCGHLLHKMCFDQLLASGHYVCPTCQTSIIDMTKMWEYLDAQAMIMPVPAAYQNRFVNILCNDCHKTSTVRFHFIGLKCFFCGGYNTTQDMKRRRSWALLGDNASSA